MSTPKRMSLLILLTAVLALGAGVFFWNLPRLRVAWGWDYRPTARLHVASHQPAILSKPEESDSRDAEVVYKRLIKTQLTLMVSRPVINSALQQPGISQLDVVKGQDDPVGWLLDHLEVTNPEETEVLEVALAAGSDASEDEQAKLVNAIVQSFFEIIINKDAQTKSSRLETLKKLSSTFKDMMRSRRELLRRLGAKAHLKPSGLMNREFATDTSRISASC